LGQNRFLLPGMGIIKIFNKRMSAISGPTKAEGEDIDEIDAPAAN
jgi:hypothetical protein